MSSVVDIVAFAVLSMVFSGFESVSRIFIATVVARIISSLLNYTFNRKAVFESKTSVKKSMVRYYILCVCQMMVSYGLVWGVTELLSMGNALTVLSKIIIDTCLFIVSFKIQRAWVFK